MESLRHGAAMDWKRVGGLAAAWLTQLLFVYTVWRLFWFLKDGAPAPPEPSLGRDALLALQFAVPHSVLLLPTVKSRLSSYIAPGFYGLMFCTATCASLLLAVRFWHGHPYELWNLHGALRGTTMASFMISWGALYYSISLTGLGHQTGYTPWTYWLRRQPVPPRDFAPRGAYCWLRHPVYLSFLGLIWFTPRMTLDHALLTAIWTAYLFVGSWLKDRRLAYYLGDRYRRYAAEVPGYPLMQFGPLARMRSV
jgi:protein-S-isoprenylcysteine O-methyltransferase Ste14